MRRIRYPRTLAAIGAAGTAVVGVTACEPTTGGLSSVAVAITTDKTGTSTLERLGFDVRWLSCTATINGGKAGTGATKSPSPSRGAAVDCQGETNSEQDITLKGKVTEERSGKCVRGDLIAKVDRKVVFQATVLGNCSGAPTRSPTRLPSHSPSGTPGATATVTVTVTATPDPPRK
ncbi:hypothetical protein ACH492_21150 [Streptomyces sp. NPDC019443]|uniref:hypothetical protein n=1 Tax=Streptomyces sp. NPDC019443 TaxID=3365061 RepID=UPI003788515B